MSRFRSKRPAFLLLLEYLIYRCFEATFQFFPPTWVDAFGRALGHAAYFLFQKRRAVVARNIRIAFGDHLSAEQQDRLVKQVFVRNGANLLGATRCMIMDDQTIQKHVTIEGAEEFQKYLTTTKKGAIFALCHMGNWEILARIAHLIAPGVPAGAFYRPLNNPWMNRMTKRRRQRSGTKLFSNKEGLTQASPLLRSGGILGVLADQHAGRTGCRGTFFGRPTSCSPLIEVLHRRTHADVFFVTITRDAPAHWKIKISAHPQDQPMDTQSIMTGLEKSLSSSPADGFWFHDRWKVVKRTPLQSPYSRDILRHASVTKPSRWLFVLSDDAMISEAATPAALIAAQQAEHTQIEIISSQSRVESNLAIRYHKRKNHLAHQIETIADDIKNPLDLIVYFCHIEEVPQSIRLTTHVISLAICTHKSSKINIPHQTNDSLKDAATWMNFIQRMGISTSIQEKTLHTCKSLS